MANTIKWPDTSAHGFVLRILKTEHVTFTIVDHPGALDTATKDGLAGLGFENAISADDTTGTAGQLRRAVGGLMVSALVKAFPQTRVRDHDTAEVFVTAAAPAEPEQFEHNGVHIYPIRIRAEVRWAIESDDNRRRREAGERVRGGDTLVETPEAARTQADFEQRQRAAKVERERALNAASAEARAAKDARRQAVQGLSATQIRSADVLNKLVRDSERGDVVTRRVWVERRIADGMEPSIEMVDKIKPMSRMQYFRASGAQQAAHERRVAAAGQKPGYWIGDFSVTKTEYDYAITLADAQSVRPDVKRLPAHSPS